MTENEVIVPLKYRERIPQFYYEDKLFAALFDAVDPEITLHEERGKDIALQFHLQKVTWGLPVWEKIHNIKPATSDPVERRRAIEEKENAKLPFKPEVLRSVANSASKLKTAEIEEDFARQIIRFIFQLEDTVDIVWLRKMYEKMRSIHALGMEAVVTRTDTIPLQVEVSSRYHDHEYLFCGDFYPEDGLEGRLYEESLTVAAAERVHVLAYPECNDFYPGEE